MSRYRFCPDPDKTLHNVENFIERNPNYKDRFDIYEREIALLFSYSQFLCNFATSNPEQLFNCLDSLDRKITDGIMRRELAEMFSLCDDITQAMKAVRIFKKLRLMHITLRDILGMQDTQTTLYDLSILAEIILSLSLEFVKTQYEGRYGNMTDNPLSVIALGKLGARELNYSSDVDIIFIFRDDSEGSRKTSANSSFSNTLSPPEFYSKVIEEYNRFLSKQTEDGFAYRVDLRLRPQGQKGPVAMSLRAYEEYYESWGQLWERAALLRAVPVAGDMELGSAFCEAIKPFVYRKYIDTETINALRNMKSQVEHIRPDTESRDIKRGFGGIREIEFFIQIFQLIYGGREPIIRDRSTLVSLHRLLEKKLIGHEDFQNLSNGYLFLRTIENRLQQVNDLQTHSLPSSERELLVLSRKMGFHDSGDFLSSLNDIRKKIRLIYDSLLDAPRDKAIDFGLLDSYYWDADSPIEGLIMNELSKTSIKDKGKAIYCLMKIRNTMRSFQTIRGMRLIEQILPRFVNNAINTNNPERTLIQLVDFSQVLAINESYLESVINKEEIIREINFVFSQSEYLSRIIMGRAEYLATLLSDAAVKTRLYSTIKELNVFSGQGNEPSEIRIFKRKREISLGMAFLTKKIGIESLVRYLSITAEGIVNHLTLRMPDKIGVMGSHSNNLAVIAFGKLGAREIIFNSDIDIIFVTLHEPSEEDIKLSQGLLRELMSYTKDGYIYKVDTRLRPDGSKGALVISLEGLHKYYLEIAKPWEIQALLKARPIGRINSAYCGFIKVREETLMKRGRDVHKEDVLAMRERMRRELSKENQGTINIKLGRGGISDIEFAVQYLQLKHCSSNKRLLSQGTLDAIKRLSSCGYIIHDLTERLRNSYLLLRNIETILRLRNEGLFRTDSAASDDIATFLDMQADKFITVLRDAMRFNETFLAEI